MKKLHILVAALMALFALSVVTSVASATATFLLAEWLLQGQPVVTPDLVLRISELTLVNSNGGGLGVATEILCSVHEIGTAGPGSADLVTEWLNLKEELISGTALTGLELVCTNDKNCESPKLWHEELPEETELELEESVTGGPFFADLGLNSKYYAECTVLGVKINELCSFPEIAIEVTNEASGAVDLSYSDAFQELSGLRLGECGGRAETFEINGLGTMTAVEGGSLASSSAA